MSTKLSSGQRTIASGIDQPFADRDGHRDAERELLRAFSLVGQTAVRSPAARSVTGTVLPVDGSAVSGI
jgi:hypothetical protein